jgi:NAD(P)-dependent dehydrogenase (short-subunit alcohol dehydrogenase family)
MSRFLVTGVSRGIGRALTSQLLAGGHEVFGVARTAAAAAGLGLAGIWEADLAEPSALALPFPFPALDGVVHAAGIVRPGSLATELAADFAEQFAVNVTSVAELTRLLLPALREAAGTVVFVNSGSGLSARSPLAGYGASKYALRAYADALRADEPSIRVSTVYPGRTSTEMQRVVRDAEGGDYDPSEYLSPDTVAGVICSVLMLHADGVLTDVVLNPRSSR